MWPSYQHLFQCSEVKVVDWQCWGSEKGCGRRQVSVWDCGLMADLGKSRFPLSGGPAFSRCDLIGPLFSNNNYWLFFSFRTWLVVKKGACISLTLQMPHEPCFSTWRRKVGIHTCASMFGIFHLQGCYSWNCKNLLSFSGRRIWRKFIMLKQYWVPFEWHTVMVAYSRNTCRSTMTVTRVAFTYVLASTNFFSF